MMAQAIDEDHYTHSVDYAPASKTYSKDMMGTRYMILIVRTLADPENEDDLKQVHLLRDAIKVSQNSAGELNFPNWDAASQAKVRDALKVLGSTVTNTDRMFGNKQEVDPIRHLIGAAIGWGGNPSSAAIYLTGHPKNDEGEVDPMLRTTGSSFLSGSVTSEGWCVQQEISLPGQKSGAP
jgi:hypothetical protein